MKSMEYILDATGRPLGRLASEVAMLLQGKRSPSYNPRLPGGVRVIVRNAGKVAVTGRKYAEKAYHHHTGYMGHLRTKQYRELFEASPAKVLTYAVRHMLPKNRLLSGRMKRFTVEL